MSRLNKPTYITKSGGRFELGMAMRIADADIRINFRIIRQYRTISEICRIYPTYASMRVTTISAWPSLTHTHTHTNIQCTYTRTKTLEKADMRQNKVIHSALAFQNFVVDKHISILAGYQ